MYIHTHIYSHTHTHTHACVCNKQMEILANNSEIHSKSQLMLAYCSSKFFERPFYVIYSSWEFSTSKKMGKHMYATYKCSMLSFCSIDVIELVIEIGFSFIVSRVQWFSMNDVVDWQEMTDFGRPSIIFYAIIIVVFLILFILWDWVLTHRYRLSSMLFFRTSPFVSLLLFKLWILLITSSIDFIDAMFRLSSSRETSIHLAFDCKRSLYIELFLDLIKVIWKWNWLKLKCGDQLWVLHTRRLSFSFDV